MGKHNLIERAIAHGGRDNVSRSPTRLPEARSFTGIPAEGSGNGTARDCFLSQFTGSGDR
jgi:hypothetical protein